MTGEPAAGLGKLENFSSPSLADRSFLSWSEEPDLELVSEFSSHFCRAVWDRAEPFRGGRRGLGGGGSRRRFSELRMRGLGGNGGAAACDGDREGTGGTPARDEESSKGPARSSELFHSELLVLVKLGEMGSPLTA